MKLYLLCVNENVFKQPTNGGEFVQGAARFPPTLMLAGVA